MQNRVMEADILIRTERERIDSVTMLPEFKQLITARWRTVVPMTLVYVTAYIGLSVLCGFARDLMGVKIFRSFNLGLTLTLLNYVIAWAIAVIYARHAGRVFDPLITRLQQARERLP